MTANLLTHAPVGLLPVLCFLGVLLYLDSYKLVTLRTVIWIIVVGGLVAGLSLLVNQFLYWQLQTDFGFFTRYVSPVSEEMLKGLVILLLIRFNRVGFLVDAAIFGFAVGSGFSVIENLFYLQTRPDAHIGVWIVRGFGTAVMHGGCTALLAIISQPITDRSIRLNPVHFLPGLVVAVVLHSAFNHFFVAPILQTLIIILVVPTVMRIIYQRSAKSVEGWLQMDFDADTELVGLINSGEFSESKAGRYLNELKSKFKGVVVVDMLCYLRIYTELALRAKGVLLMRLPLVAGWGSGSFALEDNFTRWADLGLFGENHLHKTGEVAFDPEGLVSTLPAVVTTMFGFFAGEFIRGSRPLAEKLRRLGVWGAGVAAGDANRASGPGPGIPARWAGGPCAGAGTVGGGRR